MKQHMALEILKTGRNAFLTGAAGAGKTYVLNKYIDFLRKNNIPVAVTASTGVASTHLGGQTIHSWSGIGIKDYLTDWDIDILTQKEALSRRLRNTQVLIIDEISMLKASTLDGINMILKAVRASEEPFGGMQVIFSGDFFQLPPVVGSFDSQAGFEQESVFAFSAGAWQEADLKILYLTEQHRQQDELIDILNAIREREITEDLLEKVQNRRKEPQAEEQPIILHTHNKNIDAINENKLRSLTGKLYQYPMVLGGNKAKAENMARNLLTPELLSLKEGARVMFVKNDPSGAYVNGSLGIVTGFKFGEPIVTLDGGEEITVQKATWEITNESGKVVATAEQYPLRLAWAITVHKSQGMSIDKAHMDLSKTFVEGQGYVALSRVRALDGLFLEGLNDMSFRVNDLVFERDQSFQAESESLAKVFYAFSDNKKHSMQTNFIKQYANSKNAPAPAFIKTLQRLGDSTSLADLAQKREVKTATILNHFERAVEEELNFDISHLKEASEDWSEVFKTFHDIGFLKLTPVFQKLKGKHTFEELRFARVLYRLHEMR